jgi:beta-lactamase class A
MNRKVLVIAFTALTVGALSGFYFANLFKAENIEIQNPQTPQPEQKRKHALLNPNIACIRESKVVMDELKPFKDKLEKFIDEQIKNKPGFLVSVYFRDLNNGLWHGINYSELFSPSSLMKVPVMVAILKQAQENQLSLNEKIVFNARDYNNVDLMYGVSHADGEEYTVQQLLDLMIGYSDNISTLLLIDKIGLEKVREVEKDLNFSSSENATADDDVISVKTYSSVFRILYNASYLNSEYSQKALEILSNSEYRKGIRESVPKSIKIAHKYGERDEINAFNERKIKQLHHFGIVYYPLKPYMLGVMVKGNNKQKMETIIEGISEIVYNEIDAQVKEIQAQALNSDVR